MRTPAVAAKTICDRCKKEIPKTYGRASTTLTVTMNNPWWNHGGVSASFDLCSNCDSKVFAAMNEVMK